MTQQTGTVAAVVISYNVRDLLAPCVASLEAARRSGVLAEIVVVDNDSPDGSAAAIRTRFPDVPVIVIPNRGYGAGANRGIQATSATYVLILNADTVVESTAVALLGRFLDEHPHTAIAGPRLRYPDGTIQPSRRRFPTRFTPVFESTILQELWPDNPWTRAYYMDDTRECETQTVDWVVGAAMIVRREAVSRTGGFDTTFRMFAEEVEWCFRVRRHGWNVAYVPAAEILHHEGASTSQDLPRRQIQFDSSRIELHRRLFGERSASSLRFALRIGYIAHITREATKWVWGHRRPLRAERIRLYRRALGSGLRVNESEE